MKFLRRFALVMFVALSTQAAHASDSLQLICKGAGTTPEGARLAFAMNLFDERYRASDRLDTVKMLFGSRTFVGRLVNLEMANDTATPSKSIELKEGGVVIFKGDIAVALSDDEPSERSPGSVVHLKGSARADLAAAGEFVPFSADVSCGHVE